MGATQAPMRLFALGLVIAVGLVPLPAPAADLRGWDFGDFGRLIVDFGAPAEHDVDVDGQRIEIRFDTAIPDEAAGELDAIVDRIDRFVEAATIDETGQTLTLTTAAPVRVNSFAIDTGVAIDLWFDAAAATVDGPAPAGDGAEAEPATDGAARPGQIAAGSRGDGTSADTPGAVVATDPGDADQDEAVTVAEREPARDLPVVPVRGGQHAGFSRVVLDLPRTLGYTVVRYGETVMVDVDYEANADISGTRTHPLLQIRDVRQVPTDGALSLAILIEPGTRVRYFYADLKLVVDVLGNGARVAPIPTASIAERRTDAEPPEVPPSPVAAPLPGRRPAAPIAEIPLEEAEDVPPPTLEQVPPPDVPLLASPEEEAPSDPGVGEQPASPDVAAAPTIDLSDLPAEAPEIAVAPPAPDETPVHETAVHETAVHETAVHETGIHGATDAEAEIDEAASENAAAVDTRPVETEPTPAERPEALAAASRPTLDRGAESDALPEGFDDAPVPTSATVTAPAPVEPAIETTDGLQPAPDAAVSIVGGALERVVAFDVGRPMHGAVFVRSGGLWVVFAASYPLDAAALATQARAELGPAEIVEAGNAAVLRFDLDPLRHVAVSTSGTAWSVGLSSAPLLPASAPRLRVEPDAAFGGRLVIEERGLRGVEIIDPVIGDRLIVLTVADAGIGMPQSRQFAQFRLLRSAAGIVIAPRADSVSLREVDRGIAIVSDDGLDLTRDTGDRASDRESDGDSHQGAAEPASLHARLFDLDRWRGDPTAYLDTLSTLQRRIAAQAPTEADRLRLDLARFQFANGQAHEALGVLDLVSESNPQLVDDVPSVRALRGAARIMAGQTDEAAADLDGPGLADHPEAALWRAVAAARSGDWPTAVENFDQAGELVFTYPYPLSETVALAAVEAQLETGAINVADALLTDLAESTEGASDRSDVVAYWRGRIAEVRGDPAGARLYWERAALGQDPLYHRRADLALIDLDVAEGAITPQEEIDRLEPLRYAWRGDELEFDLLRRLGDAHWRAGDLRTALDTWTDATRRFPTLAAARRLAAEIPGRLAEMFSPERVASMPPLSLWSVYQAYEDLIADLPGWLAIREQLAERLAAIELLDEADALLSQVMAETPAGAERARLGARLAAIRLLDSRPQAALAALDGSLIGGDEEPGLGHERRLLRARALSELDDNGAAMVLLEGDDSSLGNATRLDVAWRAQDWPVAARALSALVDPPPPLGEPMADDQADLLVNLGLALALAGDRTGLDRLAIEYGPAMESSGAASTFAMITRQSSFADGTADLTTIREQVAEIDLFQDFLAGYRRGTDADPPVVN